MGSDMVQTPYQFGANPVQGRDVAPRKLEDFGGIDVVRVVAFDVHDAPQLVASLPLQAFADQSPFNPEDNAAQEGEPLAWRNMCSDPASSLCSAPDELGERSSAFTRIDIVGPPGNVTYHQLGREFVVRYGCNLLLAHWPKQGYERPQDFTRSTEAFLRDLDDTGVDDFAQGIERGRWIALSRR